MDVLRIYLLGRPSVEFRSRPIEIASHKAKALLWYLASQPNQEFARSHLAALLWADSSEQEGRQSLSTTLNRLRRALPCCPIEAHNDHLTWRGGSDVWVDTVHFLERVARTTDTAALEEAADLWCGPFLEGYEVPGAEGYEEWLQQEAQQWENRVIQTLTKLVQAQQARGDWQRAIQFARRALLIDPLQERLHQTLMTCYYFAGDRGAALVQYATCKRVLRANLGVDPDDSTRQLRDAIAAGTLPRAVPGQPVGPLPESPADADQTDEPLVGRECELMRIEANLTTGGASRHTLIYGEVGRGKSRLVCELLHRLAPPRFATVVQAKCQPAWRSQPLWPVMNALGMALAPMEHGMPTGPLVKAVEDRLCALPAPILLVVEDIHWADTDTAGLLDYLLQRPAADQLSLLVTSRIWELPPTYYLAMRRWETEGRLAWFDLEPLRCGDLASLVRHRLASANPIFVHLLYEETGGNPLFALSILDAMECPDPGRLPTFPHQFPLPPYLRSVVEVRMKSLSPEAVQLINATALTKEGVSLHELERLTGLETRTLLDGLDELLRSGVVEEDPDSDRIRVQPGFVRRAITGRISQSRRRYLLSLLESLRQTDKPEHLL